MGRAGHHDGTVAAVPLYRQSTAVGLHVDLRIEQAQPDTGHDRCAGAGAAAEGFTGATFKYAQLDGAAAEDLHESGLDPLREGPMAFDQRAQRLYLGSGGVPDDRYGMRVAHRQNGQRHGHRFATDIQRHLAEWPVATCHGLQAAGVERGARERGQRAVTRRFLGCEGGLGCRRGLLGGGALRAPPGPILLGTA